MPPLTHIINYFLRNSGVSFVNFLLSWMPIKYANTCIHLSGKGGIAEILKHLELCLSGKQIKTKSPTNTGKCIHLNLVFSSYQ